MGKVIILKDALCNQIAAGEVIERPAAAVKELMENSIDAESKRISVSVLQGGRKEIRVVDNGTGMNPHDALLALERHATSKIKTLEDLQSIHSLGFRGEALPSIAAVSRFELVTREPDALSGVMVRLEGGVLREVKEAGCPAGTMVTVRDLFYNIPVRRKFLRSIDTEMAHISDQFLRLSMAHPHIHFQLSHQGRVHYDFPHVTGYEARAGQIVGVETASVLRSFSTDHPSLSLHGLAGPPELQRTNSQSLFITLNGRPVWDRLLNRAILSAYDTLLPKGKYPVLVLFLQVPPALVDVNVHPAKREIRFHRPGEVLDVVRDAIRQALEESRSFGRLYPLDSLMPLGGTPSRSPDQSTREFQTSLGVMSPGSSEGAARPCAPFHDGRRSSEEWINLHPGDLPSSDEFSFASLPVLGQLSNMYILLEAPDGLVFIDQHAAHERILFDRLSQSSPAEGGAQRLTRSAVLDLLPREAALLRRWMEHLNRMGFEIESFGGDSFIVQAVPTVLGDFAPDALLRDLLQTAHEEERTPQWDLLSNLAKTASCHRSVRAGQKLQREEIRALLEALDRTRISATCPHGRPTWFKLTHSDIARLFGRS